MPVQHVVMEDNVGLGPALDRGLAACAHEIVARMDADDVSRARTASSVQLPLIEAGADIVGSGLLEFGADVDDVVGRRTPPTDPDGIRRVIRFRDPFNHPTVVYRRSAVLAAGGYTDMAADGGLPAVHPDGRGRCPAGERGRAAGLLPRRRRRLRPPRRHARCCARSSRLQRRFRELGITSRREYLRNVVVRGGYRLVPGGCAERSPTAASLRGTGRSARPAG